MSVRISEEAARSLMGRLRDPILANVALPAPAPKTGKGHRAPKVARRVAVLGGPEGRGVVRRDGAGVMVGLDLVLDLLPVPKERPRVVRAPSGKTVSYTPARTRRFSADVRAVVDSVLGQTPPAQGPVSLTMVFMMDIPSSWPLWKQEAAAQGLIAPTGRPDMDNLEKALLDALNGRAFLDDAYVVDRIAMKRYGAQPGIWIRMEVLDAGTVHSARAMMAGFGGLALPVAPDVSGQ